MKGLIFLFFVAIGWAQCPPCFNQTDAFTTPLAEDSLPYRIEVTEADFSLSAGLHSFAFATYKGEWLLIAGRTSGLHNVDNTDPTPSANSFPIANQNTVVFVVNPETKAIVYRDLAGSDSGLNQREIDLLSVTNSLFYQAPDSKTLYFIGGYGFDNASQAMMTMPSLAAIDVPGLIKWVKGGGKRRASDCIRFISDPLLQVTGGVMWQSNPHQPYLLCFGQNFSGYYIQTSSGSYTQQIRPFQIIDNGRDLYVQPYKQPIPLDTYRRRDLNVVPIVKKTGKSYEMSYTALSGVFTPGGGSTPGAWTVPIEIEPDGSSKMLDPSDPNTFSQAINNYNCPTCGLYSQSSGKMYTLLFGGISSAIYSDGDCMNNCQTNIPAAGNTLTTCCNLPFVNDISTVEIDAEGIYRQYIMSAKYPTIAVNPPPAPCMGGPFPPVSPRIYWFGANAEFVHADGLPQYPNSVIAFDKLKKGRHFLGYIVGGIASTITDTNCTQDSVPSPYIFFVFLNRL